MPRSPQDRTCSCYRWLWSHNAQTPRGRRSRPTRVTRRRHAPMQVGRDPRARDRIARWLSPPVAMNGVREGPRCAPRRMARLGCNVAVVVHREPYCRRLCDSYRISKSRGAEGTEASVSASTSDVSRSFTEYGPEGALRCRGEGAGRQIRDVAGHSPSASPDFVSRSRASPAASPTKAPRARLPTQE